MKHLSKLFALLFCCTAAMALTSCLSNDNTDTSLDVATQAKYQGSIAGPYNGYMYFYKSKNENSNQLDSLYKQVNGAAWTASYSADSTMTVSNADEIATGMVKAFKSATIKAGSSSAEVDTAKLLTPKAVTAKIMYAIPSSSAVSSTGLNFSANLYVTATVNDGEKDFYVYFLMTGPSGYYTGQWTTARKMSMTYVLYGVFITDTRKEFVQLTNSDAVSNDNLKNIGLIISTEAQKTDK